MLPEDSPVRTLVNRVAKKLHEDDYFGAAKQYAAHVFKVSGTKAPCTEKADATMLLTTLLHWLLENNGYEEAAQLLWGPTLFDHRPKSTKDVWGAFERSDLILLMGAGSMSKSYSMGVRLFLEWVRDPEHTTIKVVGPSENHLEDNLFSHLVSLHKNSTIPLPGNPARLFIGIDSKSRKGSIAGTVVPLGKSGAGRLQGVKRVPRKKPHPKFGKLSRMFVFLDEIANIPLGIWRDIDNLITTFTGDGGLKIIGAFNPTDQEDEVGKRCEPEGGWGMFDADEDFTWKSRRGWQVVRLDAAQCENVVEQKTIYPGLQTYEGFQQLIQNSGGMDSPGYWAMGRGCFPPTGTAMSIIPAGMLASIRTTPIWYDNPTPIGGVDLALEGGDVAVFMKGSYGMASGVKNPPTLDKPNGETIMFKDSAGRQRPRPMILMETMLPLPRGDTVAMSAEIRRVAQAFGITPDWLCVDRTGNGQGVFDMLRHNWGEVTGVNYSEGASDTRIMSEDHDVAKELYYRMDAELYFALRKFIEFGYVRFSLGFTPEGLVGQLTGRRYRMQGKKSKIETKPDYKSRHAGKSPDEADALTLAVHVVRRTAGLVGGMTPDNATEGDMDDDGHWMDKPRIDVTNRFEDL